MEPKESGTPDASELQSWLKIAEANPKRCFICYRISLGNKGREGTLGPITLPGITLTRAMQISHLIHCMRGTKSLA